MQGGTIDRFGTLFASTDVGWARTRRFANGAAGLARTAITCVGERQAGGLGHVSSEIPGGDVRHVRRGGDLDLPGNGLVLEGAGLDLPRFDHIAGWICAVGIRTFLSTPNKGNRRKTGASSAHSSRRWSFITRRPTMTDKLAIAARPTSIAGAGYRQSPS